MSNDNNGINFVVIPIEVFQNENLTPIEKMLYAYISIFKSQCCFQNNEEIASKLGVGERSVTRGLQRLQELEYVFVEFVNGDSSKRRIYVIMDNPKKLKYLMKKGLINGEEKKSFPQTFPQGSQNGEADELPSQIGEGGSQNGEPTHPRLPSQIGDHRIKEYKEEYSEPEAQALGGLAGNGQPPKRQRPQLKDFASREKWEAAFYAWNSATSIA